jgi:hypothetical protein
MRHRQIRVGLALEPSPHYLTKLDVCKYVYALVGALFPPMKMATQYEVVAARASVLV